MSKRKKVKWKETVVDGLVDSLAEIASTHEEWRCVLIVGVDTNGDSLIARYRCAEASGMELLGAVKVAKKLLEKSELKGFKV